VVHTCHTGPRLEVSWHAHQGLRGDIFVSRPPCRNTILSANFTHLQNITYNLDGTWARVKLTATGSCQMADPDHNNHKTSAPILPTSHIPTAARRWSWKYADSTVNLPSWNWIIHEWTLNIKGEPRYLHRLGWPVSNPAPYSGGPGGNMLLQDLYRKGVLTCRWHCNEEPANLNRDDMTIWKLIQFPPTIEVKSLLQETGQSCFLQKPKEWNLDLTVDEMV
jgi:hypothetical protein